MRMKQYIFLYGGSMCHLLLRAEFGFLSMLYNIIVLILKSIVQFCVRWFQTGYKLFYDYLKNGAHDVF